MKVPQKVAKVTKVELNKALLEHYQWLIVNQPGSGKQFSLGPKCFRGRTLRDFSLRLANLHQYDFSKTLIENVNLSETCLLQTKFNNSELLTVDFAGAQLVGANFDKSRMLEVDFRSTDLSNASFHEAVISQGDFGFARGERISFQDTSFHETDFKYAKLTHVNFRNAKLNKVNFNNANLSYVNFSGADLRKATFEGAELTQTTFEGALLPVIDLPQGELIVYKKVCSDIILKLKIPAKAKRTACLVSNKCRAEYAIPIAWRKVVSDLWNTKQLKQELLSIHINKVKYKLNKPVYPDSYNPDITVECTNGIHFFTNESDAIIY